ncbi:IS1 family transposase, partial [Citrobacter portucalensis]
MASVSISCPSCSATDGVVRNGKTKCSKTRQSLLPLPNK